MWKYVIFPGTGNFGNAQRYASGGFIEAMLGMKHCLDGSFVGLSCAFSAEHLDRERNALHRDYGVNHGYWDSDTFPVACELNNLLNFETV